MIDSIQKLIDDYSRWVKDKTVLKKIGSEWIEITTPHLDRHNDCLQIYVSKDNTGYILTDDSYIINDLLNSGCSLDSAKRQKLLMTALAGFGVNLKGQELTVHTTLEEFSLKKHNLIQAMLAVNDLFYLASPHILSLFYEDVTKWLDDSEIRYTPRIKFSGKSGYDHMFDFVVPKSKRYPERVIQAVSNPKKETAEALVFKWLDTKETRTNDSRLYAILNNSNDNVPASVIEALNRYNLTPVLWSERKNSIEQLAA